MSQLTTCIKASLVLFAAISLFSNAHAATANGDITVSIVSPLTITKVSDLNFGVVTRDTSLCRYNSFISAGAAAWGVNNANGPACGWTDTTNRTAGVFNVTCVSGTAITHTVTYNLGSAAGLDMAMRAPVVSNDNGTTDLAQDINYIGPQADDMQWTDNSGTCGNNEKILITGNLSVESTASLGNSQIVGELTVTSNY